MAFYPSSTNEKSGVVNPKDLRFTQLDIAPSFTNRELPNVEEAISLIRGRQLDPAVFGDLTVHRDKEAIYLIRGRQLDPAVFGDLTVHRDKEAISLIRGRQLDPAVFGDLTVHTDKEGVQRDKEGVESVIVFLLALLLLFVLFVLLLLLVSAAVVAGYCGWKLYNRNKK